MFAYASAAAAKAAHKDHKDGAYVPESECSTCHGKVYRALNRADLPKMTSCFCHRKKVVAAKAASKR